MAGYVVAESTILPNLAHPVPRAERSYGFTQVSFLQLPPHLSYEQWRKIWFEQHTLVAIEAHATFHYVQNKIDVVAMSEYVLHSEREPRL